MSSGGRRPGAGRPAPDGAKVTLSVRISKGARERLEDIARMRGTSIGAAIESLVHSKAEE